MGNHQIKTSPRSRQIGQAVPEYGLILGLILLIAITVVQLTGETLVQFFENASTKMEVAQ